MHTSVPRSGNSRRAAPDRGFGPGRLRTFIALISSSSSIPSSCRRRRRRRPIAAAAPRLTDSQLPLVPCPSHSLIFRRTLRLKKMLMCPTWKPLATSQPPPRCLHSSAPRLIHPSYSFPYVIRGEAVGTLQRTLPSSAMNKSRKILIDGNTQIADRFRFADLSELAICALPLTGKDVSGICLQSHSPMGLRALGAMVYPFAFGP